MRPSMSSKGYSRSGHRTLTSADFRFAPKRPEVPPLANCREGQTINQFWVGPD
jgi:hypothetical protein